MTMNPEALRKTILEIGGEPRYDVSFPAGGAVPETLDLANFNITALRSGKQKWDPQTPGTVAITCSKIDVDQVQGARRPGEIFNVSGRGGRVSEGGGNKR